MMHRGASLSGRGPITESQNGPSKVFQHEEEGDQSDVPTWRRVRCKGSLTNALFMQSISCAQRSFAWMETLHSPAWSMN